MHDQFPQIRHVADGDDALGLLSVQRSENPGRLVTAAQRLDDGRRADLQLTGEDSCGLQGAGLGARDDARGGNAVLGQDPAGPGRRTLAGAGQPTLRVDLQRAAVFGLAVTDENQVQGSGETRSGG